MIRPATRLVAFNRYCGFIQEELSIPQRRLRILVDRHDDCLNMGVAPAVSPYVEPRPTLLSKVDYPHSHRTILRVRSP
jgi:hypothetical protein